MIYRTNRQLTKMSSSTEQISARRERVLASYREAELINYELYHNGDDKGTSEYIFPNQKEDANKIVDEFYKNNRRVISIQKKTKVGADGLMIEIAKLLTTHIDDKFVVNPANVRILTGMSNAKWEKDMIAKAPHCFKDKIFHHGKLSKADLINMRDSLIIIDEIDSGDKEDQVLHKTLEDAKVLDVKHMKDNNNRFVVISATMIKTLYALYNWGELHINCKMSIPPSYFGHKDFLEKGILKEFYPLSSKENAEKWVQEDIIDHYGTDYRVHIVRLTANGKDKNINFVKVACNLNGIEFRKYTSAKDERILEDEIVEIFKSVQTHHIVLGVKGFYRRANLIPNTWKLRIGATHELYTKIVDYNVQIQGLPGRMTGYWRSDIEGGHRTGPHRTSIKAIEDYEKTYNEPFGNNSFQTAGFKKRKGKVSADPIMLSAKNIKNLKPVDLPVVANDDPIAHPTPFKTMKEVEEFLRTTLEKVVELNPFHKIDGFELSTRLNGYYNKNKDQLLASDRLTLDKYKEIAIGQNISKTGNGQNYMVYPVYANMDTAEVSYYVRYYKIVPPTSANTIVASV